MKKPNHLKLGKSGKVKKMLWQSMRIFRGGFTVPELLRTAPGSSFGGALRWIKELEQHGIVTKAGGKPAKGQYQRYRIMSERETVNFPRVCTTCGNPLYEKCFFLGPEEKKETEKETEKVEAKVKESMWREVPEEWRQHVERKREGKEPEEVHHDAA